MLANMNNFEQYNENVSSCYGIVRFKFLIATIIYNCSNEILEQRKVLIKKLQELQELQKPSSNIPAAIAKDGEKIKNGLLRGLILDSKGLWIR